MSRSSEQLEFSAEKAAQMLDHLPSAMTAEKHTRPFVTLTYAASLDSALSLAPGVRTQLSGPESKAMTHFLRSQHAAIVVGVSTVLADDPGLNCRTTGASRHPRPVIIDPHARWKPLTNCKMLELCRAQRGLAPYVLTGKTATAPDTRSLVEELGGKYLEVPHFVSDKRMRFHWRDVFQVLYAHGLDSIMVEGGAHVISSLLAQDNLTLIDSLIITVAPTLLGSGSVVVSPPRVLDSEGKPTTAVALHSVSWLPFGQDIVLCGKIQSHTPASAV